jgi:CheY-like chemotaxis protein
MAATQSLLHLFIMPPADASETPLSQNEPQQAALLRILIVDDNADSADSLALLLKLEGHEALAVYEGNAALAAAPTFLPVVALLDLRLPGLDGLALGAALRAIPALKDIVLIAVSGYGETEDRERSLRAGFAAHLVKPVELDTLYDTLPRRSAAGSG